MMRPLLKASPLLDLKGMLEVERVQKAKSQANARFQNLNLEQQIN